MNIFRITVFVLCFVACSSEQVGREQAEGKTSASERDTTRPEEPPKAMVEESMKMLDEVAAEEEAPAPVPTKKSAYSGARPEFIEFITLAPNVAIDIRYATENNFTQSKIYDCGRCYLRPEAARALVKAQQSLELEGLSLKMFDCYRPAPYQQRLWDKVPDPNYVAPPSKGSMHSRGAAVDLTIIDRSTGEQLDMGTPYDFFGPEAHTDYRDLPRDVLKNREKLRKVMEASGFKGIRTEWWHFSYRAQSYPLSDWVWECE